MIKGGDRENDFESVRRVGKRFGFCFGMKMGDVGCRREMRETTQTRRNRTPSWTMTMTMKITKRNETPR